jgi:hypothetical protein
VASYRPNTVAVSRKTPRMRRDTQDQGHRDPQGKIRVCHCVGHARKPRLAPKKWGVRPEKSKVASRILFRQAEKALLQGATPRIRGLGTPRGKSEYAIASGTFENLGWGRKSRVSSLKKGQLPVQYCSGRPKEPVQVVVPAGGTRVEDRHFQGAVA